MQEKDDNEFMNHDIISFSFISEQPNRPSISKQPDSNNLILTPGTWGPSSGRIQ